MAKRSSFDGKDCLAAEKIVVRENGAVPARMAVAVDRTNVLRPAHGRGEREGDFGATSRADRNQDLDRDRGRD